MSTYQLGQLFFCRVPFPTLDDVYNTLTQEEDSRVVVRSYTEQTGGVSFAVQSQPRNRGASEDRDKSQTCGSCGRTGHSADTCFRQIGYPPWWGDRPRNKGPGNRGTAQTQAPMKNRGKETALVNAMGALSIGSQGSSSTAITDADRVGFSGLNETQWRTLVSMLDERKQPPPTRLSGKPFFETWILDSGATNHMTGSKGYISDIQYMTPINIKLPDGRFTVANQKGVVSLGLHIELKDVFLVEGLDCHLISVSQLTRDSYCIFQISDKLCTIQDRITKTLIGAGEQLNGLYFFRSVNVAVALNAGSTERLSRDVWHRRLGHPSPKVVDKLNVSGFSSSGVLDNKACEICIHAKHSRDLFPNSLNKTTFPFELIHCDLWGPYRTPALCGAQYFLTILDDYSRSLWLYLLPNKQQAPTRIRQFFSLVERQFDTRIKTFRSDNGSEFICLTDFFRDKGVIHETSCVGTPQQNGRVERKHKHILNVARALRFQGSLPIEFWGECALAAGYLINRTPSEVLKGKTPFEMLYKRPPPVQHLRIIGCLCYVHEQKHGGDKFASRSKRSIFLGYPFGKKGWRVFDLETRKVSVSRDVIFFEDTFPYSTMPLRVEDENEFILSAPVLTTPMDEDELNQTTVTISPPSLVAAETTPSPITEETAAVENETDTEHHDLDGVMLEHDEDVNDNDEGDSEQNQTDVAPEPVEEQILGRGHRQKIKSTRLKDFVANTIHATSCYPIEDFISCDRFSKSHRIYLAAVTDNVVPQHYSQAVLDPNFRGAMKHEIVALEDSGTWTVEDLPPGKKVLGCRWVYCIKYRADGTIERYKARLVVFGNHQVEGEDYTETFAPVAKMTTIRCFLELVAARDWEVHQMDVHNAFLHGELEEEVYMRLPPGFRVDDKNKVCRLHKSLYGLKQAPRCWFAKLSKALKDYGFVQSYDDYSLFVYDCKSIQVQVLIYVDDLIITGSSPEVIAKFKGYLSQCFKMKDLGLLKYFLGIEVARNASGIYICQRKFALDIITETGLLGAKPASFPLDQNHQLALAKGTLLSDPKRYRRLVGRLIYLRVTRPELSYAIHILSQFMQAPRQEHWEAAVRVVRYLKWNPGQGVLLKAGQPLTLTAWCDADWGACPLTRRSLTAWFIQLGDSPVSWRTFKQDTVSRSSTEAEYKAMSDTVQELIWLKNLLVTLGVTFTAPIPVHCDNISAIYLAANPICHEKTKHVAVSYHFIRDEIVRGLVTTKHVSTKLQLADILTKALGKKEFAAFLVKLGVRNLHSPT